jgi:hypothetical protein
MALSKKEFNAIADVLSNLKTAQRYIAKPTIKIVDTAYKTGMKEDVFTNGENLTGISMNKEVGSDIVYLRSAIQKLENLLYPPKNETE